MKKLVKSLLFAMVAAIGLGACGGPRYPDPNPNPNPSPSPSPY